MASPRALPCLLALAIALPCTAQADTVEVTMHASGMMNANPLVMVALGLDTNVMDRLPFDLTITSSFEPGTVIDTDFGPYAGASDADVELSFQIGSMSYHYAGKGGTDVRLYQNLDGSWSYVMESGFGPQFADEDVFVTTAIGLPAGGIGTTPLAPISLETGSGISGYASVGSAPHNPDAPGVYDMSGDANYVSLQVTSPVPEPAPIGMLAAGIFILGGCGCGCGWRKRLLFSSPR